MPGSLRPHGLQPIRLLCPQNFPGNTRLVCHFLLQRIFLTQGSNPRLLHLLHGKTDSSGSPYCCSLLSPVSLWPQKLQHSRLPWVCSNSRSLSQWWHSAISPSVTTLFSCPQSFPASRSFPMSRLLTSGGQSCGASASASVLPMNIQDWFPLGWTGWISLHSKGLSRVSSNTAVQKHQFFGI